MAKINWEEIKTEYVKTKVSYRFLADKYKISFSSIQKKAKEEHWPELRNQYCEKIVTENLNKDAKQKAKTTAKYRDDLYKLANKVMGELETLLEKNNFETLILKKGTYIRDITGALKDLADVLHVKSKADEKEQKQRLKKLQKDLKDEGKSAATVEIVMGSDITEFSK